MSELDALRQDLADEHVALDRVVSKLSEREWEQPTPSDGWAVRDQVGHLAFFDGTARLAIDDPDAFNESVGHLINAAGAGDIDAYTLGEARGLKAGALLDLWRQRRAALLDSARTLNDSQRVPWYGPAMSAKSFLTARLMETWAHGQDVVDAVNGDRPASMRLRHISRLGYLTRGWSYSIRKLEPPTTEMRVELLAPDDSVWTFGPSEATEFVRGDAEEFCLVVTQRRHLNDTKLDASPRGVEWLHIAQAFAGGPTDGPAPRSTP